MAYEVPGFAYTFASTEADTARDLSIRQFRAVQVTAAGLIEVAGADEVIHGVAQMPTVNESGEAIRVMKSGITFAEAGDAVVTGNEIVTDANGRFVPDAVDTNQVGVALTAAGAAGELFALLLY